MFIIGVVILLLMRRKYPFADGQNLSKVMKHTKSKSLLIVTLGLLSIIFGALTILNLFLERGISTFLGEPITTKLPFQLNNYSIIVLLIGTLLTVGGICLLLISKNYLRWNIRLRYLGIVLGVLLISVFFLPERDSNNKFRTYPNKSIYFTTSGGSIEIHGDSTYSGVYRPSLMRKYNMGNNLLIKTNEAISDALILMAIHENKNIVQRIEHPFGISWEKGYNETISWEGLFIDGSGYLQRVGVLEDGYVVYFINGSYNNHFFEFPLEKEGYSTSFEKKKHMIVPEYYKLISSAAEESIYLHSNCKEYIININPIIGSKTFIPRYKSDLIERLTNVFAEDFYPVIEMDYPSVDLSDDSTERIEIGYVDDFVICFVNKVQDDNSKQFFAKYPKKYEGYSISTCRVAYFHKDKGYQYIMEQGCYGLYISEKEKDIVYEWGGRCGRYGGTPSH